jgi:hypothetical protein
VAVLGEFRHEQVSGPSTADRSRYREGFDGVVRHVEFLARQQAHRLLPREAARERGRYELEGERWHLRHVGGRVGDEHLQTDAAPDEGLDRLAEQRDGAVVLLDAGDLQAGRKCVGTRPKDGTGQRVVRPGFLGGQRRAGCDRRREPLAHRRIGSERCRKQAIVEAVDVVGEMAELRRREREAVYVRRPIRGRISKAEVVDADVEEARVLAGPAVEADTAGCE